MKHFNKVFLSCILLVAMLSSNAQTISFTGHWKRITERCDAGGLSMNSVPVTVDISQDQNRVYIKNVSNTAAGIINSEDTLQKDGSSNTHTTASVKKKQSNLQWSADKKQFTESINLTDVNGVPMQKWVQQYSLVDDGKTLKISITLTLIAEDKTFQLEEYFEKQ